MRLCAKVVANAPKPTRMAYSRNPIARVGGAVLAVVGMPAALAGRPEVDCAAWLVCAISCPPEAARAMRSAALVLIDDPRDAEEIAGEERRAGQNHQRLGDRRCQHLLPVRQYQA